MMRPEILLLDEITSALDPSLIYEVMQIVRELRLAGTTMVLVTHHLEFGSRVCDRFLFLHSGRLIQDAAPQEVLANPANDAVRQYVDMLMSVR